MFDFCCWKVKNSEHCQHVLVEIYFNVKKRLVVATYIVSRLYFLSPHLSSLYSYIIIHKIMTVVLAWVAHDVTSKLKQYILAYHFHKNYARILFFSLYWICVSTVCGCRSVFTYITRSAWNVMLIVNFI